MKIKISEDFSKEPYGRLDGSIFRDMILMPKLVYSHNTKEKIIIDFDDCFGTCTAFLEEAFGGLIRVYKYNKKTILKKIEIVSNDDETVPELIEKYLTNAEKYNKLHN